MTCDGTRLDPVPHSVTRRDGHWHLTIDIQLSVMPIKRKASYTQIVDEPTPTRRRTRSTAANSPLSSPSRNLTLRGVHASPSTVRSLAPNHPPASAAVSTPTKKNSDKCLTRSQSKASAAVHSRPPIEALSVELEDDNLSEDELLLRKVATRKRSGTISSAVSRLPRVFVEIVSPAPRSPKRLSVKAVASPSSPTPNRSRVIRKVSPSPALSQTSPRKSAIAKRTRPPRPQVQRPSLHTGQPTLTQCPSRFPSSCFHAQKRAILHALHYPKTAVFDEVDENGGPSANAVVLEELKALLTGTLERGEGNSCLLIGPRGSGKSRVSVRPPDIDHIR